MKPRKMTVFPAMVGYYTKNDAPPDFDPTIPAGCPICGHPWTVKDVRSIAIRPKNLEMPISLFYRVHAACDDKLERSEREALDEQVLVIAKRIVAKLLKEKAASEDA